MFEKSPTKFPNVIIRIFLSVEPPSCRNRGKRIKLKTSNVIVDRWSTGSIMRYEMTIHMEITDSMKSVDA